MESLGRSQGQNQRSHTSKEGLVSANGVPRKYHGDCFYHKVLILTQFNPNVLVQDEVRMYNVNN